MRLIRSRPADDEDAAALVRARMARLTGEPARLDESTRADESTEAEDGRDGTSPTPEWRAALADRLPLALRRSSAGLERGHVAVIVLVVVLGAVGAVLLFGMARPEVVPIEATVDASTSPSPSSSTDDPVAHPPSGPAQESEPAPEPDRTAGPIVVHVAGLVVEPGVIELPQGSRVVDAVEAAGGPADEADLTPINLARVLSDGEQVVVTSEPPPGTPLGAPPEAPGGDDAGAGSGDASPSEPVNLNAATQAELETLPGIGPALAQRILDWRTQHGRFSVVDELLEVSGIGEQRFADIESLVTV